MFLGPLFTIYILRTMGLSYWILTICMVSWWIGNVSSSTYWGKITQKYGNLYLLKYSTILMCILPIFWISIYYLNYEFKIIMTVIINFMAGITFSGFGLSSFNFIYDISKNDEVIKFSSIVNCFKGIGIFLGSVIAGYIVDSLYIINILSEYNFTSIQFSMLISTFLRIASLFTIYKLMYYKNILIKN
jgi:predicted MFS family arabinose efflux permease